MSTTSNQQYDASSGNDPQPQMAGQMFASAVAEPVVAVGPVFFKAEFIEQRRTFTEQSGFADLPAGSTFKPESFMFNGTVFEAIFLVPKDAPDSTPSFDEIRESPQRNRNANRDAHSIRLVTAGMNFSGREIVQKAEAEWPGRGAFALVQLGAAIATSSVYKNFKMDEQSAN